MKYILVIGAALASPFVPKLGKKFDDKIKERMAVKNLHDDSACEAACIAADVACEAACALEIFGEPECGIACLAVEPACELACESGRRRADVDVTSVMSEAIYDSGLCKNRANDMPVSNGTMAEAYCNHFHVSMNKPRKKNLGDTCDDACTATEITCEVACAIDIFDEPECGLACLAVEAACEAVCASRRRAEVPFKTDKGSIQYIMGHFMEQSDFCQGKVHPSSGDNHMSMIKMCNYHHTVGNNGQNKGGYCPDYCDGTD